MTRCVDRKKLQRILFLSGLFLLASSMVLSFSGALCLLVPEAVPSVGGPLENFGCPAGFEFACYMEGSWSSLLAIVLGLLGLTSFAIISRYNKLVALSLINAALIVYHLRLFERCIYRGCRCLERAEQQPSEDRD